MAKRQIRASRRIPRRGLRHAGDVDGEGSGWDAARRAESPDNPFSAVRELAERLGLDCANLLQGSNVRLDWGAERRLARDGWTYLLILQAWPGTGMDNFEWKLWRRRWNGRLVAVKARRAVEEHARRIALAYRDGLTPPNPRFE